MDGVKERKQLARKVAVAQSGNWEVYVTEYGNVKVRETVPTKGIFPALSLSSAALDVILAGSEDMRILFAEGSKASAAHEIAILRAKLAEAEAKVAH
jgi:hypothetical protein